MSEQRDENSRTYWRMSRQDKCLSNVVRTVEHMGECKRKDQEKVQDVCKQ